MGDDVKRPTRQLPSALSVGDDALPDGALLRAAERATAPLGVMRDKKVTGTAEPRVQFSIRTTEAVRDRLNQYAYEQRLTVGEALHRLLDTAGA
jgi:hypothetical protein